MEGERGDEVAELLGVANAARVERCEPLRIAAA